MTPDPEIVSSFAPTGTLRVAINVGNAVLARRNDDGEVAGVSVDFGRALAGQLGVESTMIVVDTAGESVDLLNDDAADIGFFAIDPLRGARIAFTPPYLLIEGTYLVRENDPIRDVGEVDRSTNRVVVGKGSAYDLFLTREIKHATLVRAASSQAVVRTMLDDGIEVAAGVRQQLEADARRLGGVRVLDGRFMTIRQALGVGRSRGAEAAEYLSAFVERMKADGFVAAALARHRIDGASVAPAGNAD